MKIQVYTLRIDGRSKDIILAALSDLQQRVESAISNGATDEGTMSAYDEVGQVRRGIVIAPSEEIETEPQEVEEPVVGPEAGINGGHGVDAPTEENV
jgi:hypothetical protein